jgi:CheY-like chemotaxis protein
MQDVTGLTVLIAEDDDGHATLVRRNLKRTGLRAEAVHVRDGQELLDYLYRRGQWRDREPHEALLILLDLNMPRLGGLDVLNVLKHDARLAHIPIFVLTTTDNPNELDRCYTRGASACLIKPVDYGSFGLMIQRLAEFLLTARLPPETPASSVHVN